MLNFEEISVLDRNALYLGVPTHRLMENAGAAVAEIAMEQLDKHDLKRAVIIFCGLGNNGGDGLVAARYLSYKHDCYVKVIVLGKGSDIKSSLALEQYNRLSENVDIVNLGSGDKKEIKKIDLTPFSIIIDSMLGVGITGKLKDPYCSIVKLINSAKQSSEEQGANGKVSKRKSKKRNANVAKTEEKKMVISVDVPTGLGTNISILPDITVTFHDSKYGMTKANSGKIVIRDIGIPIKAGTYVGPGELTYIPKQKLNDHKGDNGRLLIVGGGPYTGAPGLVGMSALRTGVDLVHIAVPDRIANVVAGYSPNFIIHPLGNENNFVSTLDVRRILQLISKHSIKAMVLGPGLGRAKQTADAVIELLSKLPKELPIVIDADGFSALSMIKPEKLQKIMKGHSGVLTPHKGELKLLIKALPKKDLKNSNKFLKMLNQPIDYSNSELQNGIKSLARSVGASRGWTILFKGPVDIITDGETMKFNETGNPSMTVGGTGDVLAGITGALLAAGLRPINAAFCAAFINGYAGDMAEKKFNRGLIATDVIDMIPSVFNEYL
jgi:NAD(P)H-hydrate epimerase